MTDPFFPVRCRPEPGVRVVPGLPTVVLLTVCTHHRGRWLACHEVHQLMRTIWWNATDWLVGRYVLMPDHLHCLAAMHHRERTVEAWVQYWKSQFRQAHTRSEWRFQPGVFHHRLRNREQQDRKWRYVLENPVRAQLVDHGSDWPFQGEIHQWIGW